MKQNFLKYILMALLTLHYLALPAQFHLNGDAISLGDNCFQLTPAEDGKSGAVWFSPMLDLNQSFDIVTEYNFGCADFGADGMTFTLHPDNTGLGGSGHGQGFNYLWPSLGIEFDCHDNNSEFDPYHDHMAILKNGSTNHIDGNNLAGPVQIDPDNDNVEDCDFHEIRVAWDATLKELKVYFECELRLTYTGDIVNEIFGGDPMVYWGFTAATGAKNNLQLACLKEIKVYEPLPDYVMCPGGNIQLSAQEGADLYEWSPAESLSNAFIPDPIASPESSTTYYLTITEGCTQFIDTLQVEVTGDSLDFVLEDTTVCIGESIELDAFQEGASYLWSTGDTGSMLSPEVSGVYTVTVTLDNTCSSTEMALVEFITLPPELSTTYNSICPGETLLLDATFPSASYEWQDGSTASTFLVTEPGTYSVMVDHLCESKLLTIDISYEVSCTDIYIPNAFSPNGDNINDRLTILAGNDVNQINRFLIADRWGAIVFETNDFLPNDEQHSWDGSFKGKQLASGVYVYFAEVEFRNGETVQLRGDILLVR